MKRPWRIAWLALGGLVLILAIPAAIVASMFFGFIGADTCKNQSVAEYPSPDGVLKSVVFQRDCGATTGFTTQASLISSSATLPREAGNLFVADTNSGKAPAAAWGGPALEVRWLGPRWVALEYDKRARIFLDEKRLDDVDIFYAALP